MDEVDRKLLILIGANPRIPYNDLARKLGISRQAVHHRFHALTGMGVIKGTRASISIPYLNAIPVTVFGRSRASSYGGTLDRLGTNDLTRRALVAGGNYVYVVGILREMSELDGYVDFVKAAAEMPEPTVGIYCLDDRLMPDYPVDGGGFKRKQSYRSLSAVDLKIVACLENDARRPVSEIAKMAGITPKTARKHLEGMISDGSIEFSAPMDLLPGGDLLTLVHISLREGADRTSFGRKLLRKRAFADQYIRTFSNLPGFLIWVFWSNDIAGIRKVFKEAGEDQEVLAAMPNFAFIERVYPTWRDRLPEIYDVRRNKRNPRQSSTTRGSV